ncbi:MAG: isocitrate lyase/PEP mutase family protein [Thermoproteota archaeon]
MHKSAKLRKLINNKHSIIVPGAYDALSARIADNLGFKAIFHTGYGTAASVFGLPDIGLVSFKEMVDHVRNICDATNVPVIADADTGYGNSINTMRTIRAYIQAGAAGLILEDQKWPKKCGHMKGKEVIESDEMAYKIQAAVEARDEEKSDLVIIARTDSYASGGIEESLKRIKLYQKAGADVLFVEAPLDSNDLKKISRAVNSPLLLNQLEGGKTPIIKFNEAQRLGFKIVLYPLTSLFVAAQGIKEALSYMIENKTSVGMKNDLMDFNQLNDLVNLDSFYKLEKQYSSRRKI